MQVFIVSLSFSGSLATCKSLYNEPCIIRSTLSDLNPDELNCLTTHLWLVWINFIGVYTMNRV